MTFIQLRFRNGKKGYLVQKYGLVLEGGGMRGAYTAGILETLLEEKITFPYIIGVSAGACVASSYVSKQLGRNRRVNIDLVRHPDYLSFRNIIKKGQVFGMDFLFDRVPKELDPFDFEAFYTNNQEFVLVATDCETGKPYYFQAPRDKEELLLGLRATSSLPYMAPIVPLHNRLLLDGGLTDPVPIRKTFEDGCQKAVVVLTRNKGYRKTPSNVPKPFRLKYRKTPKVIDVMLRRYQVYNDTMDDLDELEKKGNIFIIRPKEPLKVKRVERNTDKLSELYEQGQKDMTEQLDSMLDFLELIKKEQPI